MFSNSDLLIALLTTGKSYAFLSEDTLLEWSSGGRLAIGVNDFPLV